MVSKKRFHLFKGQISLVEFSFKEGEEVGVGNVEKKIETKYKNYKIQKIEGPTFVFPCVLYTTSRSTWPCFTM